MRIQKVKPEEQTFMHVGGMSLKVFTCDERGCDEFADYKLDVAGMRIKLCKECFKKLQQLLEMEL